MVQSEKNNICATDSVDSTAKVGQQVAASLERRRTV